MDKYDISKIDINNKNETKYIEDTIEDTFTTTWNNKQFKNIFIQDSTATYIIKNKNKILGFICLKICLDEIEILNIAIDKNYRNIGLGQYFLENVINILTFKNIKSIFLEVNTNNDFAIKLYNKNGFNIISTRKDYYLNSKTNTKEDAYVMTKKL